MDGYPAWSTATILRDDRKRVASISVERSRCGIRALVVFDSNFLYHAQIDILPNGAGAIYSVDDLKVPFAGFGRAIELDVNRGSIGKSAASKNVILPVGRCCWRDINFLQFIACTVGQTKVLLGLLCQRWHHKRNYKTSGKKISFHLRPRLKQLSQMPRPSRPVGC